MFWRKQRRELAELRRERIETKRNLERVVRWIKALPARPPFGAQLIYKIETVIESIGREKR